MTPAFVPELPGGGAGHHLLRGVGVLLDSVLNHFGRERLVLKGSAALYSYLDRLLRIPQDVDILFRGSESDIRSGGETLEGPDGRHVVLLRSEPISFARPPVHPVHRYLYRAFENGTPVSDVLVGIAFVPSFASSQYNDRHLARAYESKTDTFPMLTLETLIAQKILRYGHIRSQGRRNTHWRDVFDMLATASDPSASRLRSAELVDALNAEALNRNMTRPQTLPSAPAEWFDFWDTALFVAGLKSVSLSSAIDALNGFLEPILSGSVAAKWSPSDWRWIPTASPHERS
jgi:hypothetical protein